jgi:ACS family hexuronate transporter-like MFS transporter
VAISVVTGRVLDAGFGFAPLFLFAASSYLLALAWLQLLLPRIQRAAPTPSFHTALPA